MDNRKKLIIVALVGLVLLAISLGYRGGAKEATGNYHEVMTGK